MEAFAYLLTLLTVIDLNRYIDMITVERTTIHRKMIGPDLEALISPLSAEWAKLGERYDMLAEMSEAAYAELISRERAEIQRREQEAERRCSFCNLPIPDDEGEVIGGRDFCSYGCAEDASRKHADA